jgi:hypothetical protein
MTEQQLAAVKQALEALMVFRYAPPAQRPLVLKAIADLEQVIAQDALDKKAENARELGLSYEPASVQESDELKHIGEQDFLFDVDERAWHLLVENRGGCRCHISPPCGACSNPISEEEMNEVGYTYTTPPATQPAQKPWVGLTDEEMQVIEDNCLEGGSFWDVYRTIEAKLKEKNT